MFVGHCITGAMMNQTEISPQAIFFYCAQRLNSHTNPQICNMICMVICIFSKKLSCFRHCNYAWLISHFNMGQALLNTATMFTNKVDIYLSSSVFAVMSNHDMQRRYNSQSRFEQLLQYYSLVQTWQQLSHISRRWIWVWLKGSWPPCPIKRKEVNESPKEVLRSYPLGVPWHPQEV